MTLSEGSGNWHFHFQLTLKFCLLKESGWVYSIHQLCRFSFSFFLPLLPSSSFFCFFLPLLSFFIFSLTLIFSFQLFSSFLALSCSFWTIMLGFFSPFFSAHGWLLRLASWGWPSRAAHLPAVLVAALREADQVDRSFLPFRARFRKYRLAMWLSSGPLTIGIVLSNRSKTEVLFIFVARSPSFDSVKALEAVVDTEPVKERFVC